MITKCTKSDHYNRDCYACNRSACKDAPRMGTYYRLELPMSIWFEHDNACILDEYAMFLY